MIGNARLVTGNRAQGWFVVLLTSSLWACTPGSDSPASAVANYYDAEVSNSRGALERHWWISEDEGLRDAVINLRVALADYNDALEDNAESALAELADMGLVKEVGSPASEPSSSEIKTAINNAAVNDADGSLSVRVAGRRSISVAEHQGRWYVEHPHLRANRDWEAKDLGFYTEMGALYAELASELNNGTASVYGQLSLRLFFIGVRDRRSRIMRKYDVPLLVM